MDDLPLLHELLDHWHQWAVKANPLTRDLVAKEEQLARQGLPALFSDNSRLTAKELEILAGHLSPGDAHYGAAFIKQVLDYELDIDRRLLAAIFRFNWKGGKAGFQFLPDPAVSDRADYDEYAEDLYQRIRQGHGRDPRNVLTGPDLEFYEKLPDRFTIYRGCSGVTAEVAGMGLCWTVTREYAEWFASRNSGTSVLVTARVSKGRVALAFASEGGEIVIRPKCSRALTCRLQASRPKPISDSDAGAFI